MKTVALAALMGLVTAENLFLSEVNEVEREFLKYISKNQKSYDTKEEYDARLQLFTDNFLAIMQANTHNGSSQVDLNQFADWTKEEFQQLLGFKAKTPVTVTIDDEDDPSLLLRDVAPIDWRTKGAVNPIKNQGSCGSCWAFATNGSVEGVLAAAGQPLVSLSEQQLVDCAKNAYDVPGAGGCQGGEMDPAYEYINAHPLNEEADYPYKAKDLECDAALEAKGKHTVSGYHNVKPQSVQAMKEALQNGPIAVAIQADQLPFQFYSSGILDDVSCGTNLNHGVVVVGWGNEEGKDYYITRNSWGEGWGNKGYAKIAAHDGEGICGITIRPTQPKA